MSADVVTALIVHVAVTGLGLTRLLVAIVVIDQLAVTGPGVVDLTAVTAPIDHVAGTGSTVMVFARSVCVIVH